MKLYEINTELAKLAAYVDEAEEITPELTEWYNQLQEARASKLEYLGKLLLNLDAEHHAVEGEIERLNSRKQRLEGRIDSLKTFLVAQLCGEKFTCPAFTLSTRSSQAVELEPGLTIPSQYVRTRVVESIDKELIKSDLKGGASLPFARLVTRQHLQVK